MVLVAERAFRYLRILILSSFILYLSTQARVQIIGIQPHGASYYPRSDALSLFFAVQFTLQIFWLRKLFRNPCTPQSGPDDDAENGLGLCELPAKEVFLDPLNASYVPFYTAGNIFLAGANILWLHDKFVLAQLLYISNVIAQIYAIFSLFRSSGQHSLSRKNWLTHVVAKTSTGLGLLYVWRGWGFIDNGLYPPTSELIQTVVVCLLLTVGSGPDPTLGLCLLFDLLALAYGPGTSTRWRCAYKYAIAIVGACVLTDLVAAKLKGIRIIREDTSRPSIREALKAMRVEKNN